MSSIREQNFCGNIKCVSCEIVTNFCSRCHLVPYHNENCQAQDYKRHKDFCKYYSKDADENRILIEEEIEKYRSKFGFSENFNIFLKILMKKFVLKADGLYLDYIQSQIDARKIELQADMDELIIDFERFEFLDMPELCLETCGDNCCH